MIGAAGRLALALTALTSTAAAAPILWPGAIEQEGRALLSAPDAERADAITRLVGRVGVTAAAPWLRPLLAGGPQAARLYAARLLVGAGDAASRAVVIGWLSAPQALPNERALAVDALSFSPDAEDLRATFEQAARDREALTRTEALDALARLDAGDAARVSPSLPAFLAALDDGDREVRLRAVRLVARAAEIHPAGVIRAAPLLLERLDDSDRQVRVAALAALARLRDPRTVPALARVAGGDPADLQVLAIDALGWPGNDAAVTGLADLLRRRPVDEAGRHAARALGTIATPAAVRALADALRLPPVPDEVDRALAAAGPAALDRLAREAAGSNLATAARAVALLGGLRDARAVPPLARAARQHGGEGPLALAAVQALGAARATPAVVPVLAEASEAAEPEVRQAAIEGLAANGAPEAVAVLERGLTDPDPGVRSAAARLTGRLAAEGASGAEMARAAGRLPDALADPAREVRLAAARALPSVAGVAIAAALTSLARSANLARDPEERGAIGDALAALARNGDAGSLDAAFLATPDARLFGAALAAAHARAPIDDRRVAQRLIEALAGDPAGASSAADALAAARLSGDDAAPLAAAAAAAEPAVRARLCAAIARLPDGVAWLTAWMAPDQPLEVRAAAAWAARTRPEAAAALRAQATAGDTAVSANARAALTTPAAAPPLTLRLVDSAGTPVAGRWLHIGRPNLWVAARTDGTGEVRVDGLPEDARVIGEGPRASGLGSDRTRPSP